MSQSTAVPRSYRRLCDSCSDVAVGVVTFVSPGERHSYLACQACAIDALVNSRGLVIFRSRATRAEVRRGIPGDAA